jgi:osomolarity two-component system, sensor histidine kinase SLN1
MRSLFVPLRLATDARGLNFVTDLDPNIDHVARKAAYDATGQNADEIKLHMDQHSDLDGIVVGDETRLRQVVTNLARFVLWAFLSLRRLTLAKAMRVSLRPLEVY